MPQQALCQMEDDLEAAAFVFMISPGARQGLIWTNIDIFLDIHQIHSVSIILVTDGYFTQAFILKIV